MCLNLLGELSETPLPCTRADPALIDRLRLLEAAGLVKVIIPPAHVDCDDCLRQDPATILEITPRGWEALRTRVIEDEVPPLAQLAAWFSSFRQRPGRPGTDA